MRRLILISTAVALAAAVSASPAAGAVTRVVDDDAVQCPDAAYESIQAAVDDSGAGDTVLVCDGVYVGPVVVSGPQRDGLRLLARVIRGAAIQAPAGGLNGGIVQLVGGVQGVEVSRFVLEQPAGSQHALVGVGVAPGTMLRRMRDNLVRGLDHSAAVGVFVNGGRALDISHNAFEDFAGTGVRVGPPADSFASIGFNTFTGGAFGVLIADGASGRAIANRISGATIAGIGLTQALAGGALVKYNRLVGNANGVFLQDTDGARVAFNIARGNRSHGILVYPESTGNRFDHNDARGNGSYGCRDESSGIGTAGTANRWAANRGISLPPRLCRP